MVRAASKRRLPMQIASDPSPLLRSPPPVLLRYARIGEPAPMHAMTLRGLGNRTGVAEARDKTYTQLWTDGDPRLHRAGTVILLKAMHARLQQDPAAPAKRVQQLQSLIAALRCDPAPLLQLDESRRLAALAGKLRHGVPQQTVAETCRSLRAVAKAAAMHCQLDAETKQRLQVLKAFEMPGTSCSRHIEVSIGGTVGLPAALAAGLGLRAGQRSTLSTDDALNTMRINESVVGATASLEAGLGSVAGAGLHGNVSCHRGTLAESGTAADHAALEAYERLNRPTGSRLGRLLDAPRRWWQAARGAPRWGGYEATLQHAGIHRPRLSMLASALGVVLDPRVPAALLKRPALPLSGIINTVGVGADAAFSLPLSSASLSCSRSNIRITVPLPTPSADYLDQPPIADAAIHRQRLDSIVERSEHLYGQDTRGQPRPLSRLLNIACSADNVPARDPLRVPTPGPLGAALRAQFPPAPPTTQRSAAQALDYLDAEIATYQAMLQHGLHHPAAVRAPIASFQRSWLATTHDAVMVNMLQAHARLKLDALGSDAASPLPAAPSATALRMQFAAVAGRILALGSDQPGQVLDATSVTDHLTQTIASKTLSVRLGADTPHADLAAGLTLSQLERADPNPLRAGSYLDLTVSLSAMTALSSLLPQLAGHLDNPQLLETITNALGAHSSLDLSGFQALHLRFYRPTYQSDPAYPRAAQGYRFQTRRLQRGATVSLGASGSVPVCAGVNMALGVTLDRRVQNTVGESFGDNTLTGPLLRYTRLRSTPDPSAAWSAFCTEQRPSLHALMRTLGESDSAVAHEARFLDSKRGSQVPHAVFKAMADFNRAPDTGPEGYNKALASITGFFDDLQPALRAMRAQSGLIQPLQQPTGHRAPKHPATALAGTYTPTAW